ncbi:methyltransferase domain-containing protein [Streptomyces kasugaensis]|uniref:methyltransferase domain-containing protein n=1 Tax=Streptomyces kasugaensis TaxID=1946 RepID=UPI001F5F976F|nr:methyltransferase domain-containing protein [Streptomyces kasugaensis]
MSTTSLDVAGPHLAALVEQLKKAEAIRSARWAEAFAAVPRHVFVPSWYEMETNDKGISVWRMQHPMHEGNLPKVYRDITLVTALDPSTAEKVDTDAWTGVPTSSSTLPSLMAGMLEDLHIQDGHRVLEVGTGTGYNAALLCTRLGEHLVHSIDIDPELVSAAQSRLAKIGYEPQIVPGDGQAGYPTGERFDRIIATCSVHRHLPAAWIEQTSPDGIIVADIALGIEGGLVRVSVDGDGRAFGHFTATSGRFMAARTDASTYPVQERAPYAAETETRPTTVTASDIRANYPFRLLLALELPDAEIVYNSADDGTMSLQFQRPDGTWARSPLAGDATVTYGGEADLWQTVEAAWQWWNEQGRPAHDRFGYAREPEGAARVWHIPTGRRWNL